MQDASVTIETRVVLKDATGVSDVQLAQDAILKLQQDIEEGEMGQEDVILISRYPENETPDQLRKRIAVQRLQLFARQARLLSESWHECLDDTAYPFSRSFDELTASIDTWVESVTNKV